MVGCDPVLLAMDTGVLESALTANTLESERVYLLVNRSRLLHRCVSSCDGHTNHLGTWLKCRF